MNQLHLFKIIQWLYQNFTENVHQKHRNHWRPLFLNTQSLTSRETRYSIRQKIQHINRSSIAYSTILTLTKITDADEGLYMCKLLSSKILQMTYEVRVIRKLKKWKENQHEQFILLFYRKS